MKFTDVRSADWPHQVFDTASALENTALLPKTECASIRAENAKKVFGVRLTTK